MKKHVYLHFSNFDQLQELRDDERFESSHEYDMFDAPKLFRNEYGRLRTYKNDYHVLVGGLEQENCPWCGSPAEVIKLWSPPSAGHTPYCIQCMRCGARGPSLIVAHTMETDKEMLDECMDMLWKGYKTRRPWDDGFVNPYESPAWKKDYGKVENT